MLGLARGPAARARRLAEAVDGALAKIHRVLPATLRRQVEALEATLGFTTPRRRGAPVAGATRAPARRRDPPPPAAAHRATASFAGERVASASSARTASSSTPAAGTSPRTTTCATTCARSGSTGCGARALDETAGARAARTDSTPSPT